MVFESSEHKANDHKYKWKGYLFIKIIKLSNPCIILDNNQAQQVPQHLFKLKKQ